MAIAGPDGRRGTKPILSKDRIAFNGSGEGRRCETFTYPPVAELRSSPETHYFSFCKTRRFPYDEVAAASLLTLKHHHGVEIKISSDGYQVEAEWQRAIRLFRTTFPDRPLTDLLREIKFTSPSLSPRSPQSYQIPMFSDLPNSPLEPALA